MYAPLTFEALAIAFFAALAAAAPWTAAPRDRCRRAMWLSAGAAVAVATAAAALPLDARVWLGHAYLVAGYRLPALLVPAGPAEAGGPIRTGSFESWLIRTDQRLFPFRPTLARGLGALLELSYLFCYLLVPAAFVFIWMTASPAVVDRFWRAVLLSGFVCYGLLPWLVSLPPRARQPEPDVPPPFRRLNLHVLDRASHGFNTVPSGHVAVSVAAALGVLGESPSAGAAALVVALAIAAGAVAGRYHYVTDVMAGAAVGTAAWWLT
ncbi:MAG: phosphatase PAP2 family protein [Acidobacteria bacterium]|nr:phosphatase PAP2 family protein [Acidobacteriota bacterium]